MQVHTYSIQSQADFFRDFAEAFEAARLRRPFKPKIGASFPSLEAARNCLTPKRLGLIQIIKRKDPKSIYALAKLAGRGFPSVLRDVEILKRYGLLTLTKRKDSSRRAMHPKAAYDGINLWIGV